MTTNLDQPGHNQELQKNLDPKHASNLVMNWIKQVNIELKISPDLNLVKKATDYV